MTCLNEYKTNADLATAGMKAGDELLKLAAVVESCYSCLVVCQVLEKPFEDAKARQTFLQQVRKDVAANPPPGSLLKLLP